MNSTAPHADADTALGDALRARGLRVTSPRLVLHRLLREQDSHVTAEEARDAVQFVFDSPLTAFESDVASYGAVSFPADHAAWQLLELQCSPLAFHCISQPMAG